MEIIVRRGRGSARDIEKELPDAPTYSAVRSILRLLGEKNLIVKEQVEGRDWFRPVQPAEKVRAKALHQLVRSFFSNSVGEAAVALLGRRDVKLSEEEAAQLMKLIQEARKK